MRSLYDSKYTSKMLLYHVCLSELFFQQYHCKCGFKLLCISWSIASYRKFLGAHTQQNGYSYYI